MTRVWNTLEEHKLIERTRAGHYAQVTPRREDGKADYSRPRPDEIKKNREKFFAIPDAFWLDGWYDRLTFPGIAVLLILLSETQGRDQVHLQLDVARNWYGISPKTMQNGLNDLRRHGLLGERREWAVNDLIGFGKTPRFYYWLQGDFGTSARQQLQRTAARESKKRAAKAAKAKAKES